MTLRARRSSRRGVGATTTAPATVAWVLLGAGGDLGSAKGSAGISGALGMHEHTDLHLRKRGSRAIDRKGGGAGGQDALGRALAGGDGFVT